MGEPVPVTCEPCGKTFEDSEKSEQWTAEKKLEAHQQRTGCGSGQEAQESGGAEPSSPPSSQAQVADSPDPGSSEPAYERHQFQPDQMNPPAKGGQQGQAQAADDPYICGADCGFQANAAFETCPRCGARNTWV